MKRKIIIGLAVLVLSVIVANFVGATIVVVALIFVGLVFLIWRRRNTRKRPKDIIVRIRR